MDKQLVSDVQLRNGDKYERCLVYAGWNIDETSTAADTIREINRLLHSNYKKVTLLCDGEYKKIMSEQIRYQKTYEIQ